MFKLSTGERLARWKSFRKKLDLLPIDQAIKETMEFWETCPFMPFYLDAADPESWPNPWQLIDENYYCDLAKVLGIVYTLHLSSHRSKLDPEILVYYDPESKYTYHIAQFCQGKYVINLVEGEVLNKQHINQKLKLKHRYTAVDLKLEQY